MKNSFRNAALLLLCLTGCTSCVNNYPHTEDIYFLSRNIDTGFPIVHASIKCDYERDSTLWVGRIEDLSICKDGLREWSDEIYFCYQCSSYEQRQEYEKLLTVVLKQKEKDLSLNLVGKWYVFDEKEDLIYYFIYFNSRLNTFIVEKKPAVTDRESALVNVIKEENGWSLTDRFHSAESYRVDNKGQFTLYKNGKSFQSRKCEGMFQSDLFEKYMNRMPISDHEMAPLSEDAIAILRADSLRWIEIKQQQQEEYDAQHKNDIYYVMNIESETYSIETKYDVNTFLKNIERAACIIKEETDPKTKSELKSALAKYQKKNFPIARKVFAQAAKNELWRDDIEVEFTDKTITFTSNDFYRNANIEDCYKQIRPFLEDLRFKSAYFIRGIGGGGIKYTITTYSDDGFPCIYMESQR